MAQGIGDFPGRPKSRSSTPAQSVIGLQVAHIEFAVPDLAEVRAVVLREGIQLIGKCREVGHSCCYH